MAHVDRKPLPLPPQPMTTKRLQKTEAPPRVAPVNIRAQSPARNVLSNAHRRQESLDPLSQSPSQSTYTQAHSRQPSLPFVDPRGQSPSRNTMMEGHSRKASLAPPTMSRPNSSGSDSDTGLASKLKKRSSWLPGGKSKSRHTSQEENAQPKTAWINAGAGTIDYSLKFLLSGDKVPELWSEEGDTFVYLFPRSSGIGPAFKISSLAISNSKVLISLLQHTTYDGGHTRNRSLELGSNFAGGIPEGSFLNLENDMSSLDMNNGPREGHLYFPTGIMSPPSQLIQDDIQKLVDIRNLFALLTYQPLVSTRNCASMFKILIRISNWLKQLDFNNIGGSTYGESIADSFNRLMGDTRLADVRESREKTLEALALGEAMRSQELYNEAFAHAVGKYEAIKSVSSATALFSLISPETRNRLERAYMSLQQRQQSVSLRLTNFEFPSMFAGIASSTSSDESKIIRFKQWRLNFIAMRKFVMGYYKELHGQWPPKASSKKNQFVEGGLNRLVLKVLYNDMCHLYNLLVDRSAQSPRVPNSDGVNRDITQATLRKMLDEYDRSSPPVQPPVPFDIPLVPTIATIDATYPSMDPKSQHKHSTNKLKGNETLLLLTKSHNLDADMRTPFLQSYKIFEEDIGRSKCAQDLADQRYGIWLFLYAVIQALPMLVIDAPDLKYTEAVEYFLCQPPMGNNPWMEDAATVKKTWYNVSGGQGVVSLPSDLVNHGVEATYQRSHCWVQAASWLNNEKGNNPTIEPDEMLSPLEPPPGLAGGHFGVRPQSRGRERNPSPGEWNNGMPPPQYDSRNSSKRSSVVLGLEALPVGPSDVSFSGGFSDPFSSSRLESPSGYGRPGSSGSGGRYGRSGSSGRNITPEARNGSAGEQSHSQARKASATPTASTFDQILESMPQQENVKPAKEKKGKIW